MRKSFQPPLAVVCAQMMAETMDLEAPMKIDSSDMIYNRKRIDFS